MGPKFSEALAFASEIHGTQRRKGTELPYVAHLLSVAALVIEAGGDEDTAIAALLHDAVEDQGGPPMLHRIREKYGDAVWQRFAGGRDGTLWYYRALATEFEGRTPDALWQRLDATVTELESRCRPATLRTAPTGDAAWQVVERALVGCLATLEEDECLVVSYKRANYFVQFAGGGSFGMRAEATSNTFIEPEASLIDQQYAAMTKLGWRRATELSSETGGSRDPDGSPNFFIDTASPVDHAVLGKLAVATLRSVFGITHPSDLQYMAFGQDGLSLRFPTLGLKRQPVA